MVESNCGIKALEGITRLKKVSMYSLIQMAKDNDITLYFCRVESDKLPLVKRPAILHSEDHFTLIEDEKPIPKGKYSEWVLTPKPFGTPLPHSVAKMVLGGKKGGAARSILPAVLGFVANLVIPGSGAIIGALSNIGMSQYAKSGHPEQLGKPGNWLDIAGAGASGWLQGSASQGAITGWGGARGSLVDKLWGAGTGAVQGVMHPISSNPILNPSAGTAVAYSPSTLAGQTSAYNNGASSALSESAKGYAPAASSLASDSSGAGIFASQLPSSGATTNLTQGSNIFGTTGDGGTINAKVMSTPQAGVNTASNVASVGSSQPAANKGILGGLGISDTDIAKSGISLLASQIGKPSEPTADSIANYDKASQYLQGAKLPSTTNAQLNKYLAMSIPDLKNEFYNPDAANRSMLEIDKRYQEALAQVKTQAANYGQSVETSSDARKQYDEVNRQWAEARANLAAELEQQATNQAVDIKKWALEQSLAQNTIDMQAAMELAAMIGKDQELKASVEQGNYEVFQNIIADLLNIGNTKGQGQITLNLGGTLGGK